MLLVIVAMMLGTGVALWVLANLLGEEEDPGRQSSAKPQKARLAKPVKSILADGWASPRPKRRNPTAV